MLGFRVRAHDGRLAIEKLTSDGTLDGDLWEERPFGVVLMDMPMPDVDGYTAAAIFRDRGNSIPAVAVTSHALSGERDKCLGTGCHDDAVKPIER